MNIDDACIETYIQDYLRICRETNEKEVNYVTKSTGFELPLSGTLSHIVKTIFSISNCFNLEPETKFLAVHIFDKYMCATFSKNFDESEETDSSLADFWMTFTNHHLGNARLRLLSSIQIASKFEDRETALTISQIEVMLLAMEPEQKYLSTEIVESEVIVFQTLGWKIPKNTPINYVDVLLAATNLQKFSESELKDVIVRLLDFVYLNHDKLYACLQIQKFKQKVHISKKQHYIMKADSMYLAASVILCSTYFAKLDKKLVRNIVHDLGAMTRMLSSNIQDLADLLYASVMNHNT